jgi:hypothetical protein
MPSLVIDSGLLLLLVVGSVSRAYISKHKRLTTYTEPDFDLLIEFLSKVSQVIVTPHTLTETSNLLAQIGEPAKSELFERFAQFLKPLPEHYVESRVAAARSEFIRLGLVDATFLEASSEHVLLTADAKLYLAAIGSGTKAVNFNHEREARGLI